MEPLHTVCCHPLSYTELLHSKLFLIVEQETVLMLRQLQAVVCRRYGVTILLTDLQYSFICKNSNKFQDSRDIFMKTAIIKMADVTIGTVTNAVTRTFLSTSAHKPHRSKWIKTVSKSTSWRPVSKIHFNSMYKILKSLYVCPRVRLIKRTYIMEVSNNKNIHNKSCGIYMKNVNASISAHKPRRLKWIKTPSKRVIVSQPSKKSQRRRKYMAAKVTSSITKTIYGCAL